jgi:hypothetical protein
MWPCGGHAESHGATEQLAIVLCIALLALQPIGRSKQQIMHPHFLRPGSGQCTRLYIPRTANGFVNNDSHDCYVVPGREGQVMVWGRTPRGAQGSCLGKLD